MAVLAVSQPKKVDWDLIEREYVTEEKTARELARKYDLSNSTVSAKARAEDWNGKRMAYKNAIARRSYEKIADSVAHEQTEIKKESILAARLYVRTFVKDLTDGKVHANAKDAALMIQLLINELRPDNISEAKEDAPILEVSGAHDADFLRRVLEMARGRVAATGGVGPGLLVDPETTRPN